MAVLSTLATKTPYHLFLYSFLFGSTVYQSFFSGIIAFRSLERPEFAKLQSNIFPTYFNIQTFIPPILALSAPFPILHGNIVALSSLMISGFTGLANKVILDPKTREVIAARKAQEKKEGKPFNAPEVSTEMKQLNEKFRTYHGTSTILNLITLIGTLSYGLVLSSKFNKALILK